jgi:uncharacterized damage-inducible protein DinB
VLSRRLARATIWGLPPASREAPVRFLGVAADGSALYRLPGGAPQDWVGDMSDMWTAPENDPRSYGNPVGEKATYREYLGNYRLTIEMKCEGLDADQLARRSVPPSSLSLLGLVRHLAQVENHWFERVLQGRTGPPRLYKREDDLDWEFTGAIADPGVVQDAFTTWKAEIARANEWLDGLAEDRLGSEVPHGEGTAAIRDVLVHVIEEYARHAGHADLLRECIDGRTGQ